MTKDVTSISAALAEGVEAEFMYQYEAGASAADRQLLGITTHRLAGGVVLPAMSGGGRPSCRKPSDSRLKDPAVCSRQSQVSLISFPYAAWDGDRIVGGANLFVKGDVASLHSGVTAPTHRSRGVQSTLIAARIRKARELGCRWVTSETVQARDGESNPSTKNMARAGLHEVYVRQNFVWEPND